ncbi:MAG: trypsin-like peptidase domain-containing protein [Polyangiales bacterium]
MQTSRRLLLVSAVTTVVLGAGCRENTIRHDIHDVSKSSDVRSAAPIASAAPPLSTPPVLPGSPDVATLVAKVNPAVVNITSTHTTRMPGFDFGPFGSPFGGRHPDLVLKERALGSGFIIDPNGYVVTNAHVVANAEDVRVVLADDREFAAKVKGRDAKVDLALLQLDGAQGLPSVVLGSSDKLRVGEYVVAIGNPFGLGHTVTLGIVSAKGRAIGAGPFDDFIQTDASINPGNSGGPLFDLRGEVVGINAAISASGQGIGFATPVDTLARILPDLKTTGHVSRGRLGLTVQHVDAALAKALGLDRPRGALVAQIEKSGPADKAGVRVGDLVVGVDNTEIVHAEDLPRMVANDAPGTHLKLRVLREGRKVELDATLARLEDHDDDDEALGPSRDGEQPRHGLGVAISDAPGGGALVRRIDPEGAAAGRLRPGDVVTEVNHERVEGARDLRAKVLGSKEGRPLLLKVQQQDGKTRFVAIDQR